MYSLAVCGLLVGLLVGAICGVMAGARQRRSLLRTVDELRRSEADGRALLERALEAAARHERRAGEYSGIVAGILKERDGWEGLYKEAVARAVTCQDWLLRSLGQALEAGNQHVSRLRQLGQRATKLEVSETLTELVGRFQEAHPKTVERFDAEAALRQLDEPLPPAPG